MRKFRSQVLLTSLSFILLLVSCDRRPEGVLSDGEMVSLLADMQLAESYADVASGGGNYSSERTRISDGVLAAHGVTQAQLDSTLIWYGKNIDTYHELFTKVDKELDARRRRLGGGSPDNPEAEGVGLWPYSPHIMISKLGSSDNISFSIPASEDVVKGDVLTWKMRLNSPSDLKGTMGVEYTDGATSLVNRHLSGSTNVELKLQTDSSRNPVRIFGVIRARNSSSLPLFADSIALLKASLDSSRYFTFHSQTFVHKPIPRKSEKSRNLQDSVKNEGDSLKTRVMDRGLRINRADEKTKIVGTKH